mgnify:CR=1 FL=1
MWYVYLAEISIVYKLSIVHTCKSELTCRWDEASFSEAVLWVIECVRSHRMSLCQSEGWSWQTRQDCLHWTPTSVCNNNKSSLNYPSCAGKFSDRHYCLSVHNDYLLRSKCILAWPGWLNTPSKSQLLSKVEMCTNSSISLYQWFHYSLMNEYLQLLTLNSDQFHLKSVHEKETTWLKQWNSFLFSDMSSYWWI